jgi:hypothetical protein
MVSEPSGNGKAPQERNPPKRRPIIVRIFRGLKRYENRRRHRSQQEKSDRDLIMARWTRRVGIFTAALVAVGVGTGVIFWRQLNVMQGQLDEARDEQRPWVYAEADSIKINALVYTPAQLRVDLKYKLQNVGKTPATNVIVSGFVGPNWQHNEPQHIILTKQPPPGSHIGDMIVPGVPRNMEYHGEIKLGPMCKKTLADKISYTETVLKAPGHTGDTIFPNEPFEDTAIITDDIPRFLERPPDMNSYFVTLFLCINYQLASGESYGTYYLGAIGSIIPNDSRAAFGFAPEARTITAEGLRLITTLRTTY